MFKKVEPPHRQKVELKHTLNIMFMPLIARACPTCHYSCQR